MPHVSIDRLPKLLASHTNTVQPRGAVGFILLQTGGTRPPPAQHCIPFGDFEFAVQNASRIRGFRFSFGFSKATFCSSSRALLTTGSANNMASILHMVIGGRGHNASIVELLKSCVDALNLDLGGSLCSIRKRALNVRGRAWRWSR